MKISPGTLRSILINLRSHSDRNPGCPRYPSCVPPVFYRTWAGARTVSDPSRIAESRKTDSRCSSVQFSLDSRSHQDYRSDSDRRIAFTSFTDVGTPRRIPECAVPRFGDPIRIDVWAEKDGHLVEQAYSTAESSWDPSAIRIGSMAVLL